MSKDKKNKTKTAFPKMSIGDLILFSIYSILSNKQDCKFEKLVNQSFILFPDVFGFKSYPQWPDARKLDRPLRALRNQKLIKGDPKTEFTITKEGKEKAETITKKLRQGKLL
ncbi:hypothetical protein KJ786_02805 [Patescibacteria group bacterium]|nr:hypothetical protein [Patescibacteria group bacterium]